MLETQYKEFSYALHSIFTSHVVMAHLSKLQSAVALLETKLPSLLESLQLLYQCSFPV